MPVPMVETGMDEKPCPWQPRHPRARPDAVCACCGRPARGADLGGRCDRRGRHGEADPVGTRREQAGIAPGTAAIVMVGLADADAAVCHMTRRCGAG